MTGLRAGAGLGGRLGLFDAYSLVRRAITHSQIVILTYHNVGSGIYPWPQASVSPESFERQIRYLGKVGEIMPLEQLLNRLSQGKSVNPRSVCITFDDGYRNNYTVAYPILRKCSAPATIFLATGYIGDSTIWPCHMANFAIWNTQVSELEVAGLGRYSLKSPQSKMSAMKTIEIALEDMPQDERNLAVQNLLKKLGVGLAFKLPERFTLSWDEVMEMSKHGITFGAHGVTHTKLSKLSTEQVREETTRSKREIEERLGQACTLFAYPDGKFNNKIIELVKGAGFKCALTTIPGMITRQSPPFALSRINAGRDFYTFKALLSGIYPDMLAIINQDKGRISHRAEDLH